MNDIRIKWNLQIRLIPIEKLVPYHQNARTHSETQIAQVAASILEFGWTNPILIRPSGIIIAGYARFLAALLLGLQEVPAIELSGLSEAQCRALAIADNRLALNAGWDEELLCKELAALKDDDFDLDLLGFDDGELSRLLAAEENTGLADPDTVPPVTQSPITRPGDLWLLGDHRLLCGDATDRAAIDTVLDGRVADMVFADPPYAVAYQGKTSRRMTIMNDDLGKGFYDFLRQASANLIATCRGAIYICMSSSELHTLYEAFTSAGGHWSTFLIWSKHHFTLGRSDYQRQYEPILYGWPEKVKHYWCGSRNQGDVWMIPRPVANRDHPTMKPVELVERAVDNSSRCGDTVLDPFAGSGTTLIACQRRKRRSCLIELDPAYVDVICRRWLQYTGKSAIRSTDKRLFSDLHEPVLNVLGDQVHPRQRSGEI
jgi:DNA modification methylase